MTRQSKDERSRSKIEKMDLIDRMRRQVAIDDIEIATVFGSNPDQTVISSCLACNNESKNHTEVCCYGLFKGKNGGLQWRCASSLPSKVGISRSTTNYIIDNAGSKSFKRGAGTSQDICKSLGNQLNESWSGSKTSFPDIMQNDKSCEAATRICRS